MNIIFDWSGTLVDDTRTAWEATNRTLADFGAKGLSRSRFKAEFRLPAAGFYRPRLPGVSMRAVEVRFAHHYAQVAPTPQPPPPLGKWLREARGHRLFVLTSLPAAAVRRGLAAAGLDGLFESCLGGCTNKATAVKTLMRKKRLAAADTTMVGDMSHDVESARAAGIRGIACAYGYADKAELEACNPDLIAETPTALSAALDRLAAAESNTWPLVTVGGLVFNSKRRCLLIRTQKWSGKWGTPGGKVDYGETLSQAFRREIREETGLRATSIRLVCLQDCIESPEFYKPAHFVLVNFIAQTRSTKVVLNHESSDYRWVTAKEAQAMPLNRPTRKLIRALQVGGAVYL